MGRMVRVRFMAEATVFFFFRTSRPILGPTQPPIQWPLVVIWPGIKPTTHLPLNAETKEWSYTNIPPVCMHCVHSSSSANVFKITTANPILHHYSFRIEVKWMYLGIWCSVCISYYNNWNSCLSTQLFFCILILVFGSTANSVQE